MFRIDLLYFDNKVDTYRAVQPVKDVNVLLAWGTSSNVNDAYVERSKHLVADLCRKLFDEHPPLDVARRLMEAVVTTAVDKELGRTDVALRSRLVRKLVDQLVDPNTNAWLVRIDKLYAIPVALRGYYARIPLTTFDVLTIENVIRSTLKPLLDRKFLEMHLEIARRILDRLKRLERESLRIPIEESLGISSIVVQGMELERMGRELASRLVNIEASGDLEKLYGELPYVEDWSVNVVAFLEELPIGDVTPHPEVRKLYAKLMELFELLSRDARAGMISSRTRTVLRELDEMFRKLTGSGVVWGSISSWSGLVNSATATFHRFLELLATLGRERILVIARNPLVRRFVEAFVAGLNEALRYSQENTFFVLEPSVLDFVNVIATDRDVSIRLGVTPGHATHIDLEKHVARFYDVDPEVRKMFGELLKEILGNEIEIRDHPEKHMLEIRFDPNPRVVETICALLPLTIYMDARYIDFTTRKALYVANAIRNAFKTPKKMFETMVTYLPNEARTVKEIATKISERIRSATRATVPP